MVPNRFGATMPKLIELFPDPEVLCALEPDELGLRMLPVLETWRQQRMTQLNLHSVLEAWIGGQYPGEYKGSQRVGVETAIREAWAWLEGSALLVAATEYQELNGVRSLSRRAQKLAKEPDAKRAFAARRISKEALHAAIREDVWALYHRGKYDTAVFEAMKAVEVAVQDAAGLQARDIGAPLMRKAFDAKTGKLADMSIDEGEREARAHLFAGAIGSYKNPHSHRNVALDDPDEAAEIIMLANHLLRIVDSRGADAGAR
jgi:uncharacterized protein (TIGR02391 family)